MSSTGAKLNYSADEIEAQLLRGGDSIGYRGSDWVVVMVAVTHGGPVVATVRPLTNGKPSGAPQDITLAMGEIVRLRK